MKLAGHPANAPVRALEINEKQHAGMLIVNSLALILGLDMSTSQYGFSMPYMNVVRHTECPVFLSI